MGAGGGQAACGRDGGQFQACGCICQAGGCPQLFSSTWIIGPGSCFPDMPLPGWWGNVPGSSLPAAVGLSDARWETLQAVCWVHREGRSPTKVATGLRKENLGSSGESGHAHPLTHFPMGSPTPHHQTGRAWEPLFWLLQDLESYSSPLTREQFPLTGLQRTQISKRIWCQMPGFRNKI